MEIPFSTRPSVLVINHHKWRNWISESKATECVDIDCGVAASDIANEQNVDTSGLNVASQQCEARISRALGTECRKIEV